MNVTAIIPTYNRASVLARSIDSVLQQSEPPAEILVVDDGSTDETAVVCGSFGPKVRYIWQENLGVSAARNRGIREARGEFVAFLDSDDSWLPEKLAVHRRAHQEYPEAGWSVSDAFLVKRTEAPEYEGRAFEKGFPVFDDGRVRASEHFGSSLGAINIGVEGESIAGYFGDAFDLLFSGNFVFPSCAVVRRSIIASAGMFDERLRVAEDTEFFHRISAKSPCLVISACLAEYSLGGVDSLTHGRNSAESVRNALESLERAFRLRSPGADGLQRMRKSERDLLSRLAYTYLTDFRRVDARCVLGEMKQRGLERSFRDFSVFAASWLPEKLLQLAAAARRQLR